MKVLLGIGGSDESMKTLRSTIDRTQKTGDDLTVAVIEKPEAERSQAETYDVAAAALEEADLSADLRTLEGDPGVALVDLVDREGYDMVVIGGGTESPMGKIRLGRITEFVLLNAGTTVKLVR